MKLHHVAFLLPALFITPVTVQAETITSTPATAVTDSTLKNFYQVSPDIYRSAQPNAEQMSMLDKRGIKTILNLRFFHDDRDEAGRASKLNLQHVPMEAGRVTDKEIVEALKIIKDAPKPLLVHCWHGSDRTGVVVAMYRIIFQGWSKQDAIDELKQPKFGHHEFAYRNLPAYIEQADIEKIRQEIGLDSAKSH